MHNRISVLYFQPNPAYGSAEEYLKNLVAGMSRYQEYRLTIFCPKDKSLDILINESQKYAAVYRYRHIPNSLFEIAYFYRLFRRINPDIIHFNDISLTGMAAAILSRIKYKIITYHTPTRDIRYSLHGGIVRKLAFKTKWHVIALSESLKNVMVKRRKIQADRITVIYHGLDNDKFKKINTDRSNMRKSLGIPKEKFVILNTARLCEQKAQRMLIESIKYLSKDLYTKVILLIAGEGELYSDLAGLIRKFNFSDSIKLLGYREDVMDILNCADLSVLSSDYEGVPFAIIEAMALEKPVIATDIEGVRDIVIDDVTGLLIPPRDPKKLARAIEMLLKDREKMLSMGIEGKKKFNMYFNKERMIQETYKFYSSIISNGCKT